LRDDSWVASFAHLECGPASFNGVAGVELGRFSRGGVLQGGGRGTVGGGKVWDREKFPTGAFQAGLVDLEGLEGHETHSRILVCSGKGGE
jgi:hypothetical protein